MYLDWRTWVFPKQLTCSSKKYCFVYLISNCSLLCAATATIDPVAVEANIRTMTAGKVGRRHVFGRFIRDTQNALITLGLARKRNVFRAGKSIKLADTLRVA